MRIVAFLFLSFLSFQLFCQNDEYIVKLRELWKITGENKQFESAFQKMMEFRNNSFKDLKDAEWDAISPSIRSDFFAILEKSLKPIYEKYFTLDEINKILEFANSKAGKKFLQGIPEFTKEVDVFSEQINDIFEDIALKKLVSIKKVRESISADFCKKYKTGEFRFKLPNGELLTIKRDENSHTEYRGKSFAKYRIDWESDCSYVLNLLETNDPDVEKVLKGKKIIAVITEHTGNSYQCLTGIEGEEMYEVVIEKVK